MAQDARIIGRRGFRSGLLAAIPVLLAVGPFGLIFGAVATEAGLDLAQTMAMTSLVIAGASQLAALQVLSDGAPAIVAVLTGAVVNLRMAMYSASLALHWSDAPVWTRALAALTLHDQSYALSIARYERRPDEPLADRIGFYLGVGLLTSGVWVAMTLVGIRLGAALPEAIDLGVIVPVTFIAIAAPMLRGRRSALVAAVAASVSLLAVGLPFGLGLMLGAAAGLAAGFAADRPAPKTGPAVLPCDGSGEAVCAGERAR
ncbi:AzlC family ABC transporter permease [Paralimibaculum aggregatum]|uniref:AzlC family ABC transporter permease n=1 Tax=Paralimibaculum aggregatum TaxID=3036245 RepID=A0ABQ6LLY7_9RHOB|nr:AzlC family ABC transporter permease [Limibaculum sp. NKW23]GMG83456.1 AzlC family ABC transporter permease [Limibaculum sp. NKW23]